MAEKKFERGFQLDRLGLGEEVADMLFKDKFTYQQVSDKIKEKYGLDVCKASVANYKKFILDSVPGFLERNLEYKDKLAKTYLDTTEFLVTLKEKIMEKIDHFEEDPTKWKQHVSYLQLALGEVSMLLKRAGEIKPTQIIKNEYTMNNIYIKNAVEEEIVRLIDMGDIPLELCSDKLKQFYRRIKGLSMNANY